MAERARRHYVVGLVAWAVALGVFGCGDERRSEGAATGDGATRTGQALPAIGDSAGGSIEALPATAHLRVLVYFPRPDSCEVHPFPREVPAGAPIDVVRAALDSLLAGPTAEERAQGFRSALPDTLEILRHRMRYVVANYDEPHKGRRVEIQKLEARPNHILYVSFSPEIKAYDRGATRVCAIVRQVRETVRQFPEFKDVMIAIDGKTEGTLQP